MRAGLVHWRYLPERRLSSRGARGPLVATKSNPCLRFYLWPFKARAAERHSFTSPRLGGGPLESISSLRQASLTREPGTPSSVQIRYLQASLICVSHPSWGFASTGLQHDGWPELNKAAIRSPETSQSTVFGTRYSFVILIYRRIGRFLFVNTAKRHSIELSRQWLQQQKRYPPRARCRSKLRLPTMPLGASKSRLQATTTTLF